MAESPGEHGLLVFDGVCNLCSGSVIFIIKRDPRGYFKFAPLQSAKGRELLETCGMSTGQVDSLLLVERGRCYTRSGAALRTARRLRGLWKLLYGLIVVPRPLRDLVYDFIAARRYGWFGKKDTCMVPTPKLRDRFL